MNIHCPRNDFIIVEDYFSPQQAAQWLSYLLKKGEDHLRGFHHPDLKANRFHKAPKYPVKKYMCYGLYWNPLDYVYYPLIPQSGVKPFPLSERMTEICKRALSEFFPYKDFTAEGAIVNYYTEKSSMGLHVDKDEEDQTAPVIGLNFGSTCRFFYENERKEIKDIQIPGNSLYIFGKSARSMRHGLGTIYANSLAPGSESYLKSKERINLTIRQVYSPD